MSCAAPSMLSRPMTWPVMAAGAGEVGGGGPRGGPQRRQREKRQPGKKSQRLAEPNEAGRSVPESPAPRHAVQRSASDERKVGRPVEENCFRRALFVHACRYLGNTDARTRNRRSLLNITVLAS